jgi:glutathione synthase/RimK-type ligase-like ATP-grasp enzyme
MLKVLCLTSLVDTSTCNAVADHVKNMGASIHIEHMDSLKNFYAFSIDKNGESKHSFNSMLRSEAVHQSVWYRRTESLNSISFKKAVAKKFPDFNAQNFFSAEYKSLIHSLFKILPQTHWVNTIESNHAAQSKLKNLEVAAKLGMRVPSTLISNISTEIIDFARRHALEILVKPFNSFEIVDGNKLSHCVSRIISLNDVIDHAEAISAAPVFVQSYVAKEFEIRAVVVGKQVFAIAIFSQEHEKGIVDFRCAPLNELRYAPFALPDTVKTALVNFNSYFKLEFGVFDLIFSKEGEIIFLECNSDGEWYWLELATGLKISRALAENLVEGARQCN